MRNFDLNAYGVCEMNLAEMREIEGGSVAGKVLKFIGEVLVAIGNFLD